MRLKSNYVTLNNCHHHPTSSATVWYATPRLPGRRLHSPPGLRVHLCRLEREFEFESEFIDRIATAVDVS